MSRKRLRCYETVVITVLSLLASLCAAALDRGGYRPHYQGYGVRTPGGRGGAILRVTNLKDNGPGSLRAALEATGPRIVIFETSGTIILDSPISIANPFLTVAGQTAPSPGVTVRRHPILIDTHDVVMQHLRLRQGDEAYKPAPLGNNASTLYVRNDAFNVVLDHLSLSWGNWTQLGLNHWRDPGWTDVTVTDCLIAYPLASDVFKLGPGKNWGQAIICMPSLEGRVTFARNLMVHHSHRQPLISPGVRASIFNNVAYGSSNNGGDPDGYSGFLMLIGRGYPVGPEWIMEVAALNNLYIGSYGSGGGFLAGTHPSTRSILIDIASDQSARLYLSGNVGPFITGPEGDGQWAGVHFSTAGGSSREALDYRTVPSWHEEFGYDLIPPARVARHVFANAGARPRDRDSVDKTAVRQAQTRTGARIASQNDMGGWPALAQNIRPLRVPANPYAIARGQSFRTNIEMWLERFARALEPAR